jgi:hypothetical protein
VRTTTKIVLGVTGTTATMLSALDASADPGILSGTPAPWAMISFTAILMVKVLLLMLVFLVAKRG